MFEETNFLGSVTKIFRAELDDPNLELDMSKSQSDIIEWDSLAHVRIVLAVERTFDIQFDVDEIEKIDSIRRIFEAVARHKE
jgi:acyl carrier protein